MRTQNDKLNAVASNGRVSPVNSLHLPLLANKTVLNGWSGVGSTETFLMQRRQDVLAIVKDDKVPFIARGAGRSFGDVAYLSDGMTLSSLDMKNIIALDLQEGKIVCEAGVRMGTLHQFLDLLAWSFPCYGGTQWVTLGGAVASDINSKNDVSQGSFGNHVESLLVMTPNGQEVACGRSVNRDLFHATIGGMGLTGLIKRVTLKLQQGLASTVRSRVKPIVGIEEVNQCLNETPSDFQFAAWPTFMTPQAKGFYCYATYSEGVTQLPKAVANSRLPSLKFINKVLMPVAKSIMHSSCHKIDHQMHVMRFNYIGLHEFFRNWNQTYGKEGVIEYHFVVPTEHLASAWRELTKMQRYYGLPIYWVVLKKFGNMPRAGLLSFPMAGITIDFQTDNRPEYRQLLIYFTDFLTELGGRVYLAKDSCILPRQFEKMYPKLDEWREIVKNYDPTGRVRSDLSVRLNMKPW